MPSGNTAHDSDTGTDVIDVNTNIRKPCNEVIRVSSRRTCDIGAFSGAGRESSLASQRGDSDPVAGGNTDGLTGGVACGTKDKCAMLAGVLYSVSKRLIRGETAEAHVDQMAAPIA